MFLCSFSGSRSVLLFLQQIWNSVLLQLEPILGLLPIRRFGLPFFALRVAKYILKIFPFDYALPAQLPPLILCGNCLLPICLLPYQLLLGHLFFRQTAVLLHHHTWRLPVRRCGKRLRRQCLMCIQDTVLWDSVLLDFGT